MVLSSRKSFPLGVIDDERQTSITEPSKPEVDVCIPQITPKSGFYRVAEGLAMNLVIRTERNPSDVIPELRSVFRSVSPELDGSSFTTMDQVLVDSYGDRRLASLLLEAFACVALFLCAVGLYGILTYVATQRMRELGVRLALGAQKRQLIWIIMRRAVVILISGLILGLVLSLVATRVIANVMYGVKANDPLTLSLASLLLLLTGLLASYVPARRAANVDPIRILRTQ
jgi:putative ABC transport system permease protein